MENVTLTPKRTKQTSGSQQPGSRAHDLGPGSRVDGSNFPPHPPHPGDLRERGAAALAHGRRGRRPANATPEALAVDVARLARTRYAGVNHTHLAELLAEREGIHIAGPPCGGSCWTLD